jgi:hypothetical protein
MRPYVGSVGRTMRRAVGDCEPVKEGVEAVLEKELAYAWPRG